jgi:hypothetical protein
VNLSNLEPVIKDALIAIVIATAVVVTVDALRVFLMPNGPTDALVESSEGNPPIR